MRKRRVFFFLLAALIGIATSIGYGWWLRPQLYSQGNLSNLRSDYRTDYVLMTAEIFKQEKNLEDANQRLQQLGSDSPERYAREALLYAGQLGYSQSDLQSLADLVRAYSPAEAATITPEAVQP
ncbi:hypothetical protein [Leptolinea tardivitalis]|uniref:Uncharacterized protein n=1 Tax=Leptolinea tardivitalis TaxID=229920 RepID=A0A0P6WW28_9CHLR|nr:hypothetical protein [Leptolinea tardivitalis]KPL70678.1 hypothetical protein ADM99_16470 [Leptolinea tardivitalis]GAP22311.1 hypothetical protein LTAR_02542 [Leptolinea tardivitalis]